MITIIAKTHKPHTSPILTSSHAFSFVCFLSYAIGNIIQASESWIKVGAEILTVP